METQKNDLKTILNKLKDTREQEILCQMQEIYSKIAKMQGDWYSKSKFTCPQGCGECCRNFEPDALDCEADFMAAWLLENQGEVAENVSQGKFPFPENKGCPFWAEKAEYHCTVYGARPFICRLFGGCASKSKKEELVFKPCKFYPAEKLAEHKPPLAHRQYSEQEIKEIFGALPPANTDIMENVISLNPDNHSTKLIRDSLPDAIKHLKWICNLVS